MTARGGSSLKKLICPVGVSQENAAVLAICQYGLSGLDTVSLLGAYGLSPSQFGR